MVVMVGVNFVVNNFWVSNALVGDEVDFRLYAFGGNKIFGGVVNRVAKV